jgi:hypothetical protein
VSAEFELCFSIRGPSYNEFAWLADQVFNCGKTKIIKLVGGGFQLIDLA